MRCRYSVRVLLWGWLVGWASLLGSPRAWAQATQAPVEVRVPVAPQVVPGSDGRRYVAYELHVTNFYRSTGPLLLWRVAVLAGGGAAPLASFEGAAVNQLLAHPADSVVARGVLLLAGQRAVLFIWLALPTRQPAPLSLRHQLEFETATGTRELVDGVPTALNLAPPVVLAPPLRAGPWLAHEGPGNFHSHHWGSLVAANGQLTIPQRYAIDFFGLDAAGHAVRAAPGQLAASAAADWVGYGTDVLAVADGVVRDCRDGEPDHAPLATLAPPTDLTTRTLLGNFVVLEVAPHIFVHYAHLQPGSLAVRVGQRVRRGAVLGHLGQSGNSNAPHLHFQVTTAATFEESEGLPFVFSAFTCLGHAALGEVLDQTELVPAAGKTGHPCAGQLPLDGDVLRFK